MNYHTFTDTLSMLRVRGLPPEVTPRRSWHADGHVLHILDWDGRVRGVTALDDGDWLVSCHAHIEHRTRDPVTELGYSEHMSECEKI